MSRPRTLTAGQRVTVDRDGVEMKGAVVKAAPSLDPTFPFVVVRLDETGGTLLVNRNEITPDTETT